MTIDVALVAEDILSLVVMQKVLAHTGRDYQVVRTFNEKGVGNIRRALDKYRNASRALPHVVLVDLDGGTCPPLLLEQWGVVNLPDGMMFRVAVREIESWVLADRNGFSAFFGVAANSITSKECQRVPAISVPIDSLVLKDPNGIPLPSQNHRCGPARRPAERKATGARRHQGGAGAPPAGCGPERN
jgi:hypothetical protein